MSADAPYHPTAATARAIRSVYPGVVLARPVGQWLSSRWFMVAWLGVRMQCNYEGSCACGDCHVHTVPSCLPTSYITSGPTQSQANKPTFLAGASWGYLKPLESCWKPRGASWGCPGPPGAFWCLPGLFELPRLHWGYQGPPGASWGLLGPPGASWPLLGPPGASWGLLGPPGASGGVLGPPGAVWDFLGLPGAT